MEKSKYIRHSLLCLALLLTFGLHAQYGIKSAEYYIDNDPGLGMATPLVVLDGSVGEVAEAMQATLAALPSGLHEVGIRYQDSLDNWSSVFRSVITVESALTARDFRLTQAEYYLDADPGQGSATPLLVLDGNWDEAVESALESAIDTGMEGLHTIGMRFLGLNGTWSNTMRSVISVESVLTARDFRLTQAEYYLDTDPGQGSATPLLVLDGNWDEAVESALESTIDPGMEGLHTIGMRLLGLNGIWSNTMRSVITVESVLTARDFRLTQAEYYLDTDPGQGSATPLLVLDGNWDEAVESALETAIDPGMEGLHTIGMRFLGLDGTWSNTMRSVITVESVLTARDFRLTQAEFFWDTDPGEGAATPLLVSDGAWDEAVESAAANSVTSPGNGLHTLGVRFIGLDGNWSNTFSSVITIEDALTARDFRITLMECFIDVDPGEGNAVPMMIIDGAADEAVEAATRTLDTSTLTPDSAYVLGVRTLGLDGTWSNVARSVVYIDPCTSSPTVEATPVGPLDLCPNDSILLTATAGLDSYIWYRDAIQVDTGQTHQAKLSGYYYVVGYDANGCPDASEGIVINDIGTPDLTITPSGDLNLCSVESETLTASGAFTNWVWNDGTLGNVITITTPGQYWVSGETAAGCTVFSDTLTVSATTSPDLPIISADGPLAFCVGDSVVLTSSYATGNIWSTTETTESITVNSDASITVTHVDANGCSSTSEITVVDLREFSAGTTPNDMVDLCDGQTVDIVADLSGTYTYQWLESNSSLTGETMDTYTASTSGQYAVEVTDDIGCKDTSQVVVVNINTQPTASIAADGALEFCIGDDVQLTASGGTAYLWNTGQEDETIQVSQSGEYIVSVSIGECSDTDTVNVVVESPLMSMSVDQNLFFLPAATATFSAVTNGTITDYDWDFGDGNGSMDAAPEHPYDSAGFFDVSVEVTSINGCIQSLSQEQWIQVWEVFPTMNVSPPTTEEITSVTFITSLIGCVGLADGTIYHTNDGGTTWIFVDPPTNGPINDIILTDDGNGNTTTTIVGPGGYVGTSTNYGPFITQGTGVPDDLNAVYNDGPNNYVVGDNSTVLCYDPNTGTYTNISPTITGGADFTGVYYWGGVLYVTDVNGGIWCYYGAGGWGSAFGGGGGSGGWGGIGFGSGGGGSGSGGGGAGVTGGTGAAVGGGGGIAIAPGGVPPFDPVDPGIDYNINDVVVVDSLKIICAGDSGLVLVSCDGGVNWDIYNIGDIDEDLTDVDVNACKGYLTGESGTVYQFDLDNESPAPELEIIGDLDFCEDTTFLTLDVLNPLIGSTYQWSDGTLGPTKIITTAGEYFVRQYSECDTINSDTLTVTTFNCCVVSACDEDINGDGIVNITDFLQLNSAFGTSCTDCPEDINEDGMINIQDFLILNTAYGTICCPSGSILDIDPPTRIDINDDLLSIGIEHFEQLHADLKALMIEAGPVFNLGPNPSAGDYIDLMLAYDSDRTPMEIEIRDALGKTVYGPAPMEDLNHSNTTRIRFDRPLSSGLYFFELSSDRSKSTRKFVVE